MTQECGFEPANYANVVCRGKFLGRRVGVQSVHIIDCPSRHDNVVESFLEVSHGVVHGSERKQRKGVNPYHNGDEADVQKNLRILNC